ncbi:MAG TPA: YcxB family protein [Myxococcaceae bacterium]|nr:YcxB family protein [Myxococcaceae bacterium]
MTTVGFRGTMSYGLYRRAYRAMVVPRLSLRWILTGCVVIGLLVVIALGDDVALGWGAPIVVLSLTWLWALPEIVAWSASRRDPRPEQVTGDATAERLRTTSRFGTLEFPWDSFVRVVRTDSMVLLFQPAAIAQVFPREFFDSADDFTRFGEWALAGRRASR